MRVELPTKVNGSAKYSIDQQVPGMLYGAVIRAPVEGSAPDKINDAKAKAVSGVLDVVRLPYGVGVLAETAWAAFAGRQVLEITWTRHGQAWGFDSDKGMELFAAAARNPNTQATDWSKAGDVRAEMPKAASFMEAEYRCDYAYHAQMEPLNAIAWSRPPATARKSGAARRAKPWPSEAVGKVARHPARQGQAA